MTHVVNPYAHRLGGKGIRTWKSRWSGNKGSYINFLKTDTFVRDYLNQKLKGMHVSDIEIERDEKNYKVIIKTPRSGMIIGKGGDGIEILKNGLVKYIKKNSIAPPKSLKIEIEDIRSPESDAGAIGAQIVEALEKRMQFRRILKMTAEKVMANREVKGVKISLSGRLGGAEMSRKEYIKRGQIPLTTLRADIDYRHTEAILPYGVIGVKVWIYRGEIFEKKN